MHIEHPVFETDTGVKLLAAPKYRDHKARILAWHKIPGYPLVSYVGLEQERLMESHIQSVDNHRKIAAAITIPLLVLAILGLFFFTWLALRRKHAAEIKDTYYLAIDAAREEFYVVRALYNADHTIQDFIIEDCNERGAELIGYSKKTLIGVRLSKIYSGQQSIFRPAMESGFYEDEINVPAEVSGQTTWVHRRLVRFGEGLAITLRDISEAKMHERILVDMANTDALTKLPNRHWLTGFLPAAIESTKASKSALALLYIDLDDFKNVNDILSHIIGDDLLKAASSRLKSVLRPEDHIIRLGGDEFTILLKDVTGPDEVVQVAIRVTEAFQQPFNIAGHMNSVSTSIGISLFPQDGSDAQLLLQKADFAMYSSKHDG